MLNFEKIKERQLLRQEILINLYNLYFYPTDINQGVAGSPKDIYGERNSEKHLAYHYLLTSGYIDMHNHGENIVTAMITAKGIDFVESLHEED